MTDLTHKTAPDSHVFIPSILRAYDVRGVVGESLTETDALYIGKAFGTVVRRAGGEKICMARDGRLTSENLQKAVIDGACSTGLHVIDLGVGPTPMKHFALHHLELDAAMMVTGSHSPVSHNGVKMALKSGPFYGDDILNLGDIAATGDFEIGHGRIEVIDVRGAYVDRLLQDFVPGRNLKVIWDNGNGAAGDILTDLVARLPGEHTVLYGVIDGTFPNHHPDPAEPENLVDLIQAVRERGCDLGIAFDGDGDRIGVVDAAGNIVWPDSLMALYAAEILGNTPGATVVADVKCSRVLYDEIDRLGGRGVMWNTGHSIIKDKMKQERALLAGDLSGHICFADKFYGADDALYCAIRLLNIIGVSEKPLTGLLAHLPKTYALPEIRFGIPEDRKFSIPEDVKQRVSGDICALDGVRVTTEDGWWLLRASNTESMLTVRIEGNSAVGLERLKANVLHQLEESNIDIPEVLKS